MVPLKKPTMRKLEPRSISLEVNARRYDDGSGVKLDFRLAKSFEGSSSSLTVIFTLVDP